MQCHSGTACSDQLLSQLLPHPGSRRIKKWPFGPLDAVKGACDDVRQCTEQRVWANALDGVRVPISLVYRNDLVCCPLASILPMSYIHTIAVLMMAWQ